MRFVQIIKFIILHPLNAHRKMAALADFFKWQIGCRLLPGGIVYKWVNGSKFIVQRGEAGLTGNVYCGLHEFEEMAYVLHVIHEGDIFIDAGANVGSYTILACAARGARGFCFEPVGKTFEKLEDNLRINGLEHKVKAYNVGLSDKKGELFFTNNQGTCNHAVLDGSEPNTTKVSVETLDSMVSVDSPTLLKIDVEGLEYFVLRGAEKLLENPLLHSVILELNGSNEKYDVDDRELIDLMHTYGFSAYLYDPLHRDLQPLNEADFRVGNTLFVRDPDFARSRIDAAVKTVVHNIEF